MAGRGGGGGRGGGRGGFRGGRGGGNLPPMGDVSFAEIGEAIKLHSLGGLYPPFRDREGNPLETPLQKPRSRQARNVQYQLDYLRAMRFSPYYTDPDAAVPGTSLQNDENKKGKKPGATTAGSSSKVVSLKDVKLQKEVFPQEIWREFMEGETRRVERTERRNKQKLGQDRLQSIIDQVEKVGSGGAGGGGTGAGGAGADLDAFDPGEEEDLGDYEDDMDDDYNLNYFDPGEDERDDLGDDAGGGDEGVYD